MDHIISAKKWWQRTLYRAVCLVGLTTIVGFTIGTTLIQAAAPPGPAWMNPGAMATRRIGPAGNVQDQPNLLNNLDCSPLIYRLVGSSTMRSGCFTPTAFGMLDSDSETVIFNGTDEGLPLLPYSAHQVLTPWPKALNLITLDAADVGGSYIGLYKNPVSLLQDQRNFSGQLTAKQLTGPPEISLKDSSGQRLRVNVPTMAFSDGGSWLVAETLTGSFVRINLATLDMTAFAPAFGSSGSPALLKSQVAVSDDGRFVAIANTAASSFKVYDLDACGGNASQPQNCQAYNYWPYVSQQVSGLQSLRHIRFVNDSLLSFEATSSSGALSGVYGLAPTGSIDSLTDYIGLGDSYTSGEGAFDYLDGTDTADNSCHLSSLSYPLLLTRDLFSAVGGHSVACSGATINDIGSSSPDYRGQVSHGSSFAELSGQPRALDTIQANFSAGHIAQHRFIRQYQPRVVTVSIGGNDIGFGDLLQKCVMPHVSRHTSDGICYDTYESRQAVVRLVDRTTPRWTALYKQLRAEDPVGRFYAIGYPSIASDLGPCGPNVNLSKGELEFAEELIAYLNGSIRQAANAAGIPYIDISKALIGHRLCEAAGYDTAVNGLTAGNDHGAFGINVLGRESYHPNALGHQLIEQTILRQSDNLTAVPAAQPPGNDSHDLLDAPKSGAVVRTLIPAKVTSPVLATGGNSPVHADGMSSGLKPLITYTIHFDGPDGSALSSVTSDVNGDISGAVTIPHDTPPGGHAIDITGTNQVGEPVDISQPVYVTDSSNDSDGDGIIDSHDSCPYAMNSGQDADVDGTDDTCDGQIAAVAESPLSNEHFSAPSLTASTLHMDASVAAVLDKPAAALSQTHKPSAPSDKVRGVVLAAAHHTGDDRPHSKKQSARPAVSVRRTGYHHLVSGLGLSLLLLAASVILIVHMVSKRRGRGND